MNTTTTYIVSWHYPVIDKWYEIGRYPTERDARVAVKATERNINLGVSGGKPNIAIVKLTEEVVYETKSISP